MTMAPDQEKVPGGDFAGGERTEPRSEEEVKAAREFEGDFAGPERTKPLEGQDELEAELHGDFAGGERTKPLTEKDVEPGSFAPSKD
jgi:hypothetical protein